MVPLLEEVQFKAMSPTLRRGARHAPTVANPDGLGVMFSEHDQHNYEPVPCVQMEGGVIHSHYQMWGADSRRKGKGNSGLLLPLRAHNESKFSRKGGRIRGTSVWETGSLRNLGFIAIPSLHLCSICGVVRIRRSISRAQAREACRRARITNCRTGSKYRDDFDARARRQRRQG